MPFSYRSGWIIALSLALIVVGFAQPRTNKDGTQRGNFARYLFLGAGLALLLYTIHSCSNTDSLI